MVENVRTAKGGWGLVINDQSVRGRLRIHHGNISSTRCELHALIMGLAASIDSGTQICDNTGAIMIFEQQRRQQRTGIIVPKYSDKHRIEKRTIQKLLQNKGTFTCKWVRSHQEHITTEDPEINIHRNLLAKADTIANSAIKDNMTHSYTHIYELDSWTILDEQTKPVLGKTIKYLRQKWHNTRLNKWHAKQIESDNRIETICEDALPMSDILRWDIHQKRFYWRAIANTLHTNAKKSKFGDEWDKQCRMCKTSQSNSEQDENAEQITDTQSHRYAMTTPKCIVGEKKCKEKYIQIEKSVDRLLSPDQEIYVPWCGGEFSKINSAQYEKRRPLWQSKGEYVPNWKPMTMLVGGIWAHGVTIKILTTQRAASLPYIGHIQGKEKSVIKAQKGGKYIPYFFQYLIQQSMDDVAVFDIVPSQWIS